MATVNPLKALIGGIAMTLILVIVVPVISKLLIYPMVEDLIGDTQVDWVISLSSSVISAIVMLVVMLVFMLLLGGGAIIKKFGIIGIIGLVVAYWLLGDIYGCVFPICVILLMTIIAFLRGK